MFCTRAFFPFSSKRENESKYHDLRSKPRKKMKLLVNLLLLLSFLVFNMMKILVKTFMTYSFARV